MNTIMQDIYKKESTKRNIILRKRKDRIARISHVSRLVSDNRMPTLTVSDLIRNKNGTK